MARRRRRQGPKEWEPGIPQDVRHVEMGQCLVIVAPEWFERPDFQAWREESGVPTWASAGDPEESDTFIVFADEELDYHLDRGPGIPRDIARTIMRLVEERQMEYGVVWIKAV